MLGHGPAPVQESGNILDHMIVHVSEILDGDIAGVRCQDRVFE